MELNPVRVCEFLLGLGDVEVIGVDDDVGLPLRVQIRGRAPRLDCGGCDGPLWSDGEKRVELVDLPALGGRCVWCGTSDVGVARTRCVRRGRSPNRALLWRRGQFHRKARTTSIVDIARG